MKEETKAREIAKDYLDTVMGGTLHSAKRTLKVAWSEYQDRIQNIEHLNEQQKLDTKRRVADAIEKQLGVIIEIHPESPSISEDNKYIEKEMVNININTKYLDVSCYDGKDFETELNLDAELLVGLIHEIAKGRY